MLATLKSMAGYLVAALVSVAILICVQRLWRADLSVPFIYVGDAVTIQVFMKSTIEHGWYLHNPALGVPGGCDLHDYPMVDSLHYAIIKLLSFLTADQAFLFNLYYLLTFPLTTLSSLLVLRRHGISYGLALAASLLYSFLPYHFWRGENHLLLAAYYLVPVMVLLLLWLCSGEGIFFHWDEQRQRASLRLRSVRAWAGLGICVLMACGGIYYAFFGCFLLVIAGAFSFLTSNRSVSLWNALCCLGLIVGIFFAQLAPTFLYQWKSGTNPQALVRSRSDPETYALKIVQLLLPATGHRWPMLARWKAWYNTQLPPNENDSAAMGVAGSIGFLLLIGRLLSRRGSPAQPRPEESLSILNLFAVLLGTIGGFGILLSFVIGPYIRGYNRMSVYIAFFSIFALFLALERLKQHGSRSRVLRLTFSALPLICLVLGILDQTSAQQIPPYASVKQEYRSDAEFVKRIEAVLPSQAMIFELPYSPFPEGPVCVHQMIVFDQARPYLHSKHLRWSYGAMQGRAGDAWQRQVASLPLQALLDAIVQKGFLGLCLDRNAYPDHGASLEAQVASLSNTLPQVSANQRLAFFDLRSYMEKRMLAAVRQQVAPPR